MKVEASKVTKLTVSEVEHLDPISIYLEDFGPERGKVTITCFNDSWSCGWFSMGKEYDIRRFILSCGEDYLVRKLAASLDTTSVDDPDRLEGVAKGHIATMRRSNDFSKTTAKDLWGLAEELGDIYAEMDGQSDRFYDAMYRIFGEEWWHFMPKKPSHQYEYLCRIVSTVKAALSVEVVEMAAA